MNLESGADVASSSERLREVRPTRPWKSAATRPRRRAAPCAASPSRPSVLTASAGERSRTRCPASRPTTRRPCARGARSATRRSTRPGPAPPRQINPRCDRRARAPRPSRHGAGTRALPRARQRPRRPTRAVRRPRAWLLAPHAPRRRSVNAPARCRRSRRLLHRRPPIGRLLPVPPLPALRWPGPRSSGHPRPPSRRVRTRPHPGRQGVPRRSARRPSRPRRARPPRGRPASSRGRAPGAVSRVEGLHDLPPGLRARPRPGRCRRRATARRPQRPRRRRPYCPHRRPGGSPRPGAPVLRGRRPQGRPPSFRHLLPLRRTRHQSWGPGARPPPRHRRPRSRSPTT